jgi:hypothetical protein
VCEQTAIVPNLHSTGLENLPVIVSVAGEEKLVAGKIGR